MTGNERVRAVIEGRTADRTPVYAWVKSNLSDELTEAFGSVEAFEDRYDFDLTHVFSGYRPYDSQEVRDAADSLGRPLEPADLLEIQTTDPCDAAAYEAVRKAILHHKTKRGRFAYLQTPGVFEAHNGYFGIENHLAFLLLYPEELERLYSRMTDWVIEYARVCLELGIDMIHVSDDWGSQHSMLFAPEVWWTLVYPHHARVVECVHQMGGLASLHSDGNVNEALDGIVRIGYDVVHPYQESAGMSFDTYMESYASSFAVMGGIDIQRSLGFGEPDRAMAEIDRVLDTVHSRGIILCTTHFVQSHCTVDELTEVFDHVYTRVRSGQGEYDG